MTGLNRGGERKPSNVAIHSLRCEVEHNSGWKSESVKLAESVKNYLRLSGWKGFPVDTSLKSNSILAVHLEELKCAGFYSCFFVGIRRATTSSFSACKDGSGPATTRNPFWVMDGPFTIHTGRSG